MDDLLIKKYQPRKLKDFKIHKNIILKLINVLKDNNIMNLLLYGKHGCGKYTIMKFYIETYFIYFMKYTIKLRK